MSNKFNIGDKVRFTESRGGYGSTIGSTGKIIEVLAAGRGYTVECPHTTSSGWSNLTFFESEIAGLVEEEPFAREGVIYRRTGGALRGTEFRLKDGVLENRTPPFFNEWTPSAGWYNDSDFNAENFEIIEPEDTRSEMNRKMDTVREAGERRRQKVIAHTHRLEEIIRDKNAEIEFLRRKLTRAQNGVIQANDALYDANFRFVKPSKLTNIPF